jgi:hypothetical protein
MRLILLFAVRVATGLSVPMILEFSGGSVIKGDLAQSSLVEILFREPTRPFTAVGPVRSFGAPIFNYLQ